MDADITQRVHEIEVVQGSAVKKKPVTYDEVDMEQMSLFDTVKDDDIIKEIRRTGYFQSDAAGCAEHAEPAAEQAAQPVVITESNDAGNA